MPSLKDLRIRIGSVKSTRKITSAMKMVAAAEGCAARRNMPRRGSPMPTAWPDILSRLSQNIVPGPTTSKLLTRNRPRSGASDHRDHLGSWPGRWLQLRRRP